MSRLPIRVRLTAAFALATVLVLCAACAFVFVQLRGDLDDSITGGLRTRLDAAAHLAQRQGTIDASDSGVLTEVDESFAQLLSRDGRVLAAIGAVRTPPLASARAAPRAAWPDPGRARSPWIRRRSAGPARAGARPWRPGLSVVAVGQSLEDRNEALAALVSSFAIGTPLAVVLASLIGYGLATAGLQPVEAMRRRANDISLSGDEDRLPLPAAHDEIRRLGETLNTMLDRLRRSFERERRFVADASHELRTPVAVVRTEIEGALRSGDYGPGVQQALVAAVEECDRLAQLAEDLLVLARAADGRLPTRPEPLPARPLLEDARERFADRAAQRHRVIRVEASDDLSVVADPLRLRQALANLVDNALRHGAGDVTLLSRRLDGGVEVAVRDEGPGFTRGMADRAFERFTRGDEARSSEGAGLGLAIVKAIAEAHGGTAAVADEPGSTSVRIWLPDAGGSQRPLI